MRQRSQLSVQTNPPVRQDGLLANIVFVVQSETGGSAGPVKLTYHGADGVRYVWTGGTDYQFRPGMGCVHPSQAPS